MLCHAERSEASLFCVVIGSFTSVLDDSTVQDNGSAIITFLYYI